MSGFKIKFVLSLQEIHRALGLHYVVNLGLLGLDVGFEGGLDVGG